MPIVPGISTSSPTQGESNVYLNATLYATFSGDLLSSTVNEGTVTLTDTSSNRSIIGSILYDSPNRRIIFDPETYLTSDTNYRWSFVGSDLAIGAPITSSGNNQLVNTIDILFSTGKDVDRRDEDRHKDSVRDSLEGDLDLPANIAVIGSEFTVDKFIPKQQSAYVPAGTTGISITFTKALSTGDFSQDWFDVNWYPLMDDDQYLAADINGSITFQSENPTFSGFQQNYWSGSVDGNRLILSLTGGLVVYNQLYEVTLSKDIKSATGDTLANQDTIWSFATELYPDIAGTRVIRRQAPAATSVLDAFTDEYIAAKIHEHTFLGWESSSKRYSIANLPNAMRNYVIWSCLIDIIEDAELEKALEAGIRRQLGDYLVSVDSNVVGKMSLLLSRAKKKQEMALKTLRKDSGVRIFYKGAAVDGNLPDRLWHGVNGRIVDNRFRYYQPNLPASNLSIERAAEVPERFKSY